MSTPEEKFDEALASVKTAVGAADAKVRSVWASYEVYVVAAVSLIVGAVIGHAL